MSLDDVDLNASMRPHQEAVTRFLLGAGCGASFLDTGLGKTLIALEWSRVVHRKSGKPVLMLAPLAVGPQHAGEARRFGIDAAYLREPPIGALPPIVITNYERLGAWDLSQFGGVALDESSILKSFAGKVRTRLIETFRDMPYRLASTATPAPNDHMELGNHAEFLGVMASREMLSRWFINDTSMASQKWRLKGHAAEAFWAWVASWSRCVSMPSDIGFDDEGYDLPELIEHIHVVDADRTVDAGDDAGQALLFRMPDMSATGRHKEKRLTLAARAESVAQAVCAEPDEPWVVWVETDAEADALKLFLPAAVEVRGSMQADKKEDRLAAFSEGRARVLITKASIAGFGLNWQHCARMAFAGVSHSYEAYYQAVRRCWRFGQKRRVHVHVAMADTERPIFATVQRKAGDHDAMKGAMRAAMRHASGAVDRHRAYDAAQAMEVPAWLD
ncbi:MAG: helicase-related protein [Pseudomonadota bacterium]